jgi:hypothetical protein
MYWSGVVKTRQPDKERLRRAKISHGETKSMQKKGVVKFLTQRQHSR